MSVLLAAICGLVGFSSDYNSIFPALGGPNGLLYDLTLKIAQPWRRDVQMCRRYSSPLTMLPFRIPSFRRFHAPCFSRYGPG